MIDSLSSGISALKSAYDLISVIRNSKSNDEVERLTIDLRQQLNISLNLLTETQLQCQKFIKENHDLQSEIASLKQHNIERDHYELYRYPLGSMVYRIKAEHQAQQPVPDLCATCFNKGVKAILQPVTDRWSKALKCHHCDSVIDTESKNHECYVVPNKSRWDD